MYASKRSPNKKSTPEPNNKYMSGSLNCAINKDKKKDDFSTRLLNPYNLNALSTCSVVKPEILFVLKSL